MSIIYSDRLIKGFIAGVIGGIVIDLYSYIAHTFFQFGKLGFVEWMGLIIYGNKSHTLGETLFAFVSHLLFTGVLGIIFAYIIPQVKSRSYLFKGWLYGVTTWMLIYTVTILFKLQGTFPIHLGTALSNFIGASIYGVVLALVYAWLVQQERLRS